MRKTSKAKFLIKAAIVTVIALALILPATAIVTNTETGGVINISLPALHKSLTSANAVMTGNVLISGDNPGEDDQNPKVTKDGAGNLVVVYESVLDPFTKYSNVAFSADSGDSWELAFQFDSLLLEGTGELVSGDIMYNPTADQIFWTAVDPTADMYNLEMAWIPSPITDATEATWSGISGTGADEHFESSCGVVDRFAFTPYITDEPDYNLYRCPGLGYWDVNFDYPPNGMGGFYYDGGSILETTPASNMEADTGTYRLFMTMQVGDGKVAFKATTTDMELLDSNGGGPGGMDRYADIEVWPWQNWISESGATDPDVSGDNGKVCVAYVQDGQVTVAYCHDVQKEVGEDFTFQTSTIGAGGYPAVYMTGDTVFVGYINGGNLFIVKSEDAGITWGDPEQINDVDGTVVGQPESVGIDAGIIAWTDSRNGAYDVYYAPTEAVPLPILEIKDISGGIGVSAVIENNGDAAATNLNWEIILDGTVFLGSSTTGTEASLGVGDSVSIKSGFPLGFGSIDISISASCDEGVSASASASGNLLLFFVTGL
jgi:hypothetical protein